MTLFLSVALLVAVLWYCERQRNAAYWGVYRRLTVKEARIIQLEAEIWGLELEISRLLDRNFELLADSPTERFTI